MRNLTTYQVLTNLCSATYYKNPAAYDEAKDALMSYVKTMALTGDDSLLVDQVCTLIDMTDTFSGQEMPEEIVKDAKNLFNWCRKNGFGKLACGIMSAFEL